MEYVKMLNLCAKQAMIISLLKTDYGNKKFQKAQNKVLLTFTRKVKAITAVQLKQKVTATKAVTAALQECG